ncbi:MAG: transcription-repair coupling factor [candidate division KSB1 bacterium]|nr:transcription-repair coupling factor [candidate division KSB1 bacterium]
MMTLRNVQSLFEQSSEFERFCTACEAGKRLRLAGLGGSSPAFVVAAAFRRFQKQIVVILHDMNEAKQFCDDLESLCDPNEVLFFPAFKQQLWNEIGPAAGDIGRRINVIKHLCRKRPLLLVTTIEAMMEKIGSEEDTDLYSIVLKSGAELAFTHFVRQLAEMGYNREERVDFPGEFSVRGGIVDIFLFEAELPYRIEFFGDQIESIRRFDPESQKSIESCNELEIFPPACGGPFATLHESASSAIPFNSSLIHYLEPQTLLWMPAEELLAGAANDYEEAFRRRFSPDHPSQWEIEPEQYYFSYSEVNSFLDSFQAIRFTAGHDAKADVHFGVETPPSFGGNLRLAKSYCGQFAQQYSEPLMVVACGSEIQEKRIQDLFEEEEFPQVFHFSTAALSSGFIWPAKHLLLLTPKELYGRFHQPKTDRLAGRNVLPKTELTLRLGDYVVHDDYGIGIFRGLEKITAYGRQTECLTIEYRDGDRLYVPLEKMDRVQKYAAQDAAVPELSKLGGVEWEKLKTRTRKRIKEIAKELIELYAERKSKPGYAFSSDTVWEKELEASFEYEETIDQLAAIRDVKADMCSPYPMERLICGDVGYGKTEVAVRAAFKAVLDGKQVALLAPTTILAQQHYNTFRMRMKSFPVRIEVLSRFKSEKEQKEIVQDLREGKIDLIIGTHRLLSNDVQFKDLGLLIIDEEQRFGVMHKEKIKMMKKNVDTLLMSATPIPRTLHMAIVGAKDISIINSPPHNRLPIITEISRFDPDLIRQAILFEKGRGGQVFFVHNRIQSIYNIASHLRQLVPEASIDVAHGQMKPRELEDIMLRFINGSVDVLVSTMIIENGIDMPRANTLIINRADKLGLAQLYQLRGRVGRSDQQAFAYLLVPPLNKLSREAVKRLQAIQEFTALGSGFKIAMRDLEIRGAGNIFGAEQSGFIHSLGYELYTRVLQEAVTELRQELNLEPVVEKKERFETLIEGEIDAYIPEDYISSAAERIDVYRRLVMAEKIEEIESIKAEVVDRFGSLPQRVQNLFDYLAVKLLASLLKFKRITIKEKLFSGEIGYEDIPLGQQRSAWLSRIAEAASGQVELRDLRQKNRLIIEFRFTGNHKLVETKNFLQKLL